MPIEENKNMKKPQVVDRNSPDYKKRTPIGADTTQRRRLPIFDPRDRMAFPHDPRKHRIWVTDIKNQVQDFLDSGFNFVMKEDIGWVGEGNQDSQMEPRVSLNVGRADVKDNAIAYLMEMDMADWLEIKQENDREKREVLNQLKRDVTTMKRGNEFYGPGLDIK